MKIIRSALLSLLVMASANTVAEQHGHGEERQKQEESGRIHLTEDQLKAANITVEPLQASQISLAIEAPGEVALDGYATARVAPRISAQILKRHKNLGDHANAGDPLITLSSVEAAEAQGEFIVADREWRRVQELGKKTVSGKRYVEARVKQSLARARLKAFGMTDNQIDKLQGTGGKADGEVVLLAPMSGVVIQDDFILGELAQPGRALMTITDEDRRWINTRLNAEQARQIKVAATAKITTNDRRIINGEVTQLSHTLDETTRTRLVRVAVANPDDALHPGQFVTVSLQSSQILQGLIVPDSALQRGPDGDWAVFVEEQPGEFEMREVERVQSISGKSLIKGLEPGTIIATTGSFFLMSEQNKSGFEVHDH